MRGYGSYGRGQYGNRRKILVIVILLVLLIIGLAIFFAIKFSKRNDKMGSVLITVDPMCISDTDIVHFNSGVKYSFKGTDESSSSYSSPINAQITKDEFVLFQYIINNTGNTPVSYAISLDLTEQQNCEITYSKDNIIQIFEDGRISGSIEKGRTSIVNVYLRIIDEDNNLSVAGSLGLTVALG